MLQPGVLHTEILPTCLAWSFCYFQAAFPSVSWKLLFFFIGKAGLPEGMLNFLNEMYTCVMACSAENREENLLEMFSGILQGCPLSGSLFVIAINPLLLAFEGISPGKKQAVVTACADAIGIVLQQLRPASGLVNPLPCLRI